MAGGLILLLLVVALLVGLFLVPVPDRPLEWLGRMRTPASRARKLLREILGEESFQHLERNGYIDIPSSTFKGRVYRVPYGAGQVEVIEHGMFIAKLCLVTVGWVPPADRVLTHKLLIEGDEDRYLRTANQMPASGSRRISRWYP